MLSVVVPVRGGLPRFRLMLKSLLFRVSREARDTQVIIVNDGGSPEVSQVVHEIKAHFAEDDIRVLSIAHGGRSVARNCGAGEACGERLLFLDADLLIGEGVLKVHSKAAGLTRGTIKHMPWLAAFDDPVSGTFTERAMQSLRISQEESGHRLRSRTLQVDEQGRPSPSSISLARFSRFERDIHSWFASLPLTAPGRWIGSTGAQLSVGRQTFLNLDGFDERMGLDWGAEDLEFGYRAEQGGVYLTHAPDSVVWHMDHDASGRDGHHDRALEYFAHKHSDPAVLKLRHYFAGKSCLEEVFACAQIS